MGWLGVREGWVLDGDGIAVVVGWGGVTAWLTGKVVGSALVAPSNTWRTVILPFYRCENLHREKQRNAISLCDMI